MLMCYNSGEEDRVAASEVESSVLDSEGAQQATTPQERVWSADRIRRVLLQYSKRLLGVRIGISVWRHIA